MLQKTLSFPQSFGGNPAFGVPTLSALLLS